MILTLLTLNLLDLILTILNRGNFAEANPLTRLIIDNVPALVILKLIIVPALVYVLWRYKDKNYVKLAVIALSVVYAYAVIVGGLIWVQ